MGTELLDWYKSVAGIAGAAVAAGYAIRAMIGENKGFLSSIPVVVYVLLSCVGLAWVADAVMGAELADTFPQLLVLSVTAALVAVGAVGTVSNLAKPLAQTVRDAKAQGGTFVALLAIAGLAAGASACATRGGVNVSPEGQLAIRGNQVVQALRATINPAGSSPVEQLVAQKLISTEEAIKVVEVIRQQLVYAQDLAAVLKVVDDAREAADRDAGLAKASKLVQQIAAGLSTANLSIVNEKGRAAVVGVLQAAASALLLVGSIWPIPGIGADAAAVWPVGIEPLLAGAGF